MPPESLLETLAKAALAGLACLSTLGWGVLRRKYPPDAIKTAALTKTTAAMMPPGLLSIVTDLGGILVIAMASIPLLRSLALIGAFWVVADLIAVFIFFPALMNYLPPPVRTAGESASLPAETGWLASLLRRAGAVAIGGRTRWVIAAVAVVLLALGIDAARRVSTGYSFPGTPLYRPGARVNLDIAAIAEKFSADQLSVFVETDRDNGVLHPSVQRWVDRFKRYMLDDPAVGSVVSFTDVQRAFNRTFHLNHPKYLVVPATEALAGDLQYLQFAGSGPGEMEHYLNLKSTVLIARLFIRDHTAETLDRVHARIAAFEREWPMPPGARFRYSAGIGGLYKAANDVLGRTEQLSLMAALAVVFVFCTAIYASAVAGVLMVVASVLANYTAFIFMNWAGIGVTIDTFPMICLGIGLGVNYSIYIVSRIGDELRAGRDLEDACATAIKTSGTGVVYVVAVIVAGVLLWGFSPVLFHVQMGSLIAYLMITNMLGAFFVVPALVVIARPRFLRRAGSGTADGSAAATNQGAACGRKRLSMRASNV